MDQTTPQTRLFSAPRLAFALVKVRWLRASSALMGRFDVALQDRAAQRRAKRLMEMARSDKVHVPKAKRAVLPEKKMIGAVAVLLLFCWLSAGKIYFGSTRAVGATLPNVGSTVPLQKSAGEGDKLQTAALLPFTPRLTTPDTNFRYALEEETYQTSAILVPGRQTRLEARANGKIAHVYVHADDSFRTGDMLMVYHCEAAGKVCMLRAGYDGKVARVYVKDGSKVSQGEPLLSVVANGYSAARFDVPSKWLRWINIGADVTLTLPDSGKTYQARIEHIDNLVNPDTDMVSIDAALNPAEQGVLWGMKGEVTIDARTIREAGIRGYLESASAQ
ncbi:MAG: HlyD family efflux transporter periplasmic adaptor subunit [Pseudobdellovibrionaceae bacterium]